MAPTLRRSDKIEFRVRPGFKAKFSALCAVLGYTVTEALREAIADWVVKKAQEHHLTLD